MSDLYYAAACQTAFACPSTRAEIGERVTRMIAMAENTIVGYEPFFDVRLLAFPEFAHAAPIYDSVEKLRERLAMELPNEHTDRYVKLCKKYGCYIQTGSFLEVDRKYPDVVFNATVLVGPGGVLSKYRKVNPWIPWELHASPHDLMDVPPLPLGEGRGEGRESWAPPTSAHASLKLPSPPTPLSEGEGGYKEEPFPVVKTELGNLGVAICYDWLFPETIRQIAFNGAEVIVRVSAYMDPWGATPPTDWWTLFNRSRAAENTVYVVAANQGASLQQYPPFSWPGGSMVVDFDGRILAQADAGEGEKVVVAPIDVGALRQERKRRVGHDMRAHLRSEVHPYMRKRYLAPAGGDNPLTDQSIRRRIADAKRVVQDE
ncbi:MAG: hypothetical protein L0Y44_06260 [Phycisphaerales bacterium]|nr:hypothetical protein [Phycisphaerales bacterium]